MTLPLIADTNMSGKRKTMDSLRTQRTHSAALAKTQWKRRLMMAFVSIVLQLVKTSWAQTTELSATTEDLKSIEAGNRSM